MKTIYIGSDYMCHLESGDERTAVETDMFDRIVDRAIPYYRYIPQGEEYTNSKGRMIHGLFVQATNTEMIDRMTLQSFISDMQNALNVLEVGE